MLKRLEIQLIVFFNNRGPRLYTPSQTTLVGIRDWYHESIALGTRAKDYFRTTANEKGLHAAGEQERTEATNIAKAASQIHSLKHFVMSTLPPASLISNNVHSVPHFDYKYMAYQWIETNLPELASKTTLVWLGWYTSNLANVPFASFIPIVSTYAWIGRFHVEQLTFRNRIAGHGQLYMGST